VVLWWPGSPPAKGQGSGRWFSFGLHFLQIERPLVLARRIPGRLTRLSNALSIGDVLAAAVTVDAHQIWRLCPTALLHNIVATRPWMQSIRISSPVFLGVGVKNDVEAFYVCDAEVVKVASSLSPVVSLHPLDLLPSAATSFVFVGVH
jgi:hypothetical protein